MKKLIYLGVLLLAVLGLYASLYLTQMQKTIIVRQKEVSRNHDITLNASNAAIKIERTTKNNVVITERANVDYEPRSFTITGQNLSVYQGQSHVKMWQHLFPTDIIITVGIPENYQGIIKVKSTSGALTLADIQADGLDVQIASGSINGSVTVKTINISSQSGEINLTADYLSESSQVVSTSGAVNLNLPHSHIGKIKTYSDSGDVSVGKQITQNSFSAVLKITTKSGSINVK